MNPVYYLYAKKVAEIGTRIEQISARIGTLEHTKVTNIEELKDLVRAFKITASEYQSCRQELSEVKPPELVKQEHNAMVENLQRFVDSTRLMSNSANLDAGTIDATALSKGINEQTQATAQTVSLANLIADKLEQAT